MSQIVDASLAALAVGPPIPLGELTLLPLFSSRAPGLAYLGLAEALETRQLVISEVSHAGEVPELALSSSASLPVLLVEGEALIGARQDRFVNASLLVPPGAGMRIPVSCMEAGRWSWSRPDFVDGGLLASDAIRRRTQRSVLASLAAGRGRRSDQAGIWSDIDQLHARAGSRTETRSLKHVLEQRDARSQRRIEALPGQPGQLGLARFEAGRLRALELCSRDDVWSRLQPKLLRSLLLERSTLEHPRSPARSVPLPEDWLTALRARMSRSDVERYASPGLGHELRFEAPDLDATALVHAGELLHLAVYCD